MSSSVYVHSGGHLQRFSTRSIKLLIQVSASASVEKRERERETLTPKSPSSASKGQMRGKKVISNTRWFLYKETFTYLVTTFVCVTTMVSIEESIEFQLTLIMWLNWERARDIGTYTFYFWHSWHVTDMYLVCLTVYFVLFFFVEVVLAHFFVSLICVRILED